MSNDTCETMNSTTGAGFCKENYREQKVLSNSSIYSTCAEQQWDDEKTELASATSTTSKSIKGNFRLRELFFFLFLHFFSPLS